MQVVRAALLAMTLLLVGCRGTAAGPAARTVRAPPPPPGLVVAIFAGGCFWCMEGPFESLPGVVDVVAGYTGGTTEGPTYAEVSSHRTGHREAVRVLYDPARVGYAHLLEVYWHNVDPFQADGQFCDRGPPYRSAIFVLDAAQRALAEASRVEVARRFGRPVATEVLDAAPFWVAEAYHQDYHRTHPERYRRYREGCGRDRRLRELWGASSGGGAGG